MKQGLSEYFCVIPALADIGDHSWTIHKYYHLDKCIFIPKRIAESRKCGGLQVFRNITDITKDANFCTKPFGEYRNIIHHALMFFKAKF